MAEIIAFANQKGGVGKTMTVSATASILTQKGYRVLMVDQDAQRNLDMVAGTRDENLAILRTDQESLSVLDVLEGRCTIKDAIISTEIGDLVRATNRLYSWMGDSAFPLETKQAINRGFVKMWEQLIYLVQDTEAGNPPSVATLNDLVKRVSVMNAQLLHEDSYMNYVKHDAIETMEEKPKDYLMLSKQLETVENDYDFILIDTNPTITLLTMSALFAASYVVIPVFSERSSAEAVIELTEAIQGINGTHPEKNLVVAGVLMTKYTKHLSSSKRHDVMLPKLVNEKLKLHLFSTRIRQTAKAAEYMESRMDVVRYDPKGNTSQDYYAYVEELLERIKEIKNGK